MNRELFSYKGIKRTLVELACLTVLLGVVIIIQAYCLAAAISSLFGGDLFANVRVLLAGFFLALIARQLLTVWKKRIAFRFAARTAEEFRKKLLQKFLELGPRFIREEGSGKTITLVMEGIMKFRHYLEILLPKSANAAVIPIMVAIFVLYEDIRSAIILFFAVPILIGFMILLGLAAKSKANRQYKSYQMLSNHFVDSLRGLETLKYLGLSKSHSNQIHLVSERYRKATMGTLKIAFLSSFALDFFTMLSIAMVAVFLGLGLINGTMHLQAALTILILAPEYFLPIREIGADFHATLDGKEAGAKIEEILNHKHDVNDKQVDIPQWNSTSTLSVHRLGMHFADTEKASLEDIQFSVTGTKKIGIIGTSGSGKSTLVDLLSGFLHPTEGKFLVNGVEMHSMSQKDWQSQVTYIPQHPYLFSDSVLNNIRFYHPEASVEEVNAAAEKAGISEMIKGLSEGLGTLIGEGGRMLSGGQEQRIALARAFLGDRKIMMLDEPTAHLDIETEYELKQTMLKLFEDKLVFFATHRLHWMPEMDEIIVLQNGKIVETGNHEQLMKRRSAYFQLVKTQLEDI